jgi:hypothetical protein
MKRNCFLNCRLECMIPVVVLLSTLSVARPLSAAGSGVRGQVLALDEQGKLTGIVAGATIELTNQAGQVAGRATSDAQGAYKIDIAPGSYLYKVRAAGFRDENVGRGIQLKLTEGYSVYNFSLTKGKNDPNQQPPTPPTVPVGKLQGRVLEKTGDGKLVGIPGATVSLRGSGSRGLLTAITGRQSGEATAGHYEITLAAGTWNASASAPGFRPAEPASIDIQDGQTAPHDFILTRTMPPPIAGAQGIHGTVRVRSQQGADNALPPVKITSTPVDASATSVEPSADGRDSYSQDLRPATYQVVAEAPGYLTARSGPKAVFATKYTSVNLTLVRSPAPVSVTFEGVVFEQTGEDENTKHSLPGATVEVRRQGAAANPVQEQSDGEGRVQMTIPGGLGDYQATARMSGFRPQSVRLLVRDPSEHHAAEFVLKKLSAPLTFQGTVFVQRGDDTATRRPLPEATVQISPLGGGGDATPVQGTTDGQGRAGLSVLTGPGKYQAIASKPNLGSQTLRVVIRPSGENGAEVVLKLPVLPSRQPTFQGIVYVQQGQEPRRRLPGATVRIWKADWSAQGQTDQQGAVRLTKLPGPGGYQAQAEMKDCESPAPVDVVIRPSGETRQEFVLILRKPSPRQPSFAATVVGKSGDDVTAEAPLAEATVWISKPDGSGKVRGVTGSNGQAGLNVPAGPGDYIAGAELRGYRPVRANVTIGSAGVTTHKFFMTRAGLVLDVIVVDDRKQPLVGASVELRRQENGGLTQGRTAAGGRVRLNVTAGPGNYELSAQLNGYKPGRRTVAISEGGHGRETIVLEKQQTAQPKLTVIVSGQNAGGATTLLSGAAVQISRNNHPMKAGRTDSRGRFTLNLAPGDYQVRVSSPGCAPANFAKVTVGPDGREEKIVLHANIQ